MDSACPAPLRSDASRNRAALVSAAREVFGERGLDAPLDEIARRACVGNATLYRRFPTRQQLVDAVFTERMVEYAHAVDDALANPDAWAGFRDYVLRILRLQAQDRGLADLLVTSSADPSSELEALRQHAYEGVVELIERAKGAGALRPDFVSQDLVLLLMANAGLVHRMAGTAPDAWERLASFLLDGLQAAAATPGPTAAVSVGRPGGHGLGLRVAVRALLLTGQYGAGKTAVAAEIQHQLAERGVRSAAIDLDWLCWVGPGVEGAALDRLLEANLAALVANFRAAGVDALVLARALLGPEHRAVVERGLGDCTLTVVRLLVDDALAVERVGARDTGAELDELLADADGVARAVASAGVEDLVVTNDGSRSLGSVATDVLARCGWLDG